MTAITAVIGGVKDFTVAVIWPEEASSGILPPENEE